MRAVRGLQLTLGQRWARSALCLPLALAVSRARAHSVSRPRQHNAAAPAHAWRRAQPGYNPLRSVLRLCAASAGEPCRSQGRAARPVAALPRARAQPRALPRARAGVSQPLTLPRARAPRVPAATPAARAVARAHS